MIYLGLFTAGDTVFYAANFHNQDGTLEDPTGPEAQLRDPSGTWVALTAPSKQNSKTGHFGGTIDTTDFVAGQYAIRLAGTVTTGKVQAAEFTFTVGAVVASVTADVGITQGGADKVWTSTSRLLTGPDNITSNNAKLTLDGAGNVTLISAYDAAKTAAPADTALSNLTWTDEKAGLLDVAISSRSDFDPTSILDGAVTWEQSQRAVLAFVLGLSDGATDGAGNITFRRQDGSTAAITMTVDANGNRSVVVKNLS